ncbi:hypothetical protein F5887DRAFT_955302 [Amanita rubescens]|nr:hypothetical protein F5887DRAFT_955302 [Amanita rubescens]
MRSFNLSFLATLTFAALSAAAPVPITTEVSTRSTGNGTVDLSTFPAILTYVNSQLSPIQDELQSLVGVQNIDVLSVVQPQLNEVQIILSNAVSDIRAIAQSSTAGVLTVSGEVVTLADLVTTILTVTRSLVGSASIGVIQSVLVTIGSLFTTILTVGLPLVSGLIAALAPLLGSLVTTLTGLGFSQVLQIFSFST